MTGYFAPFLSLPRYGLAAVILLLLYGIQSEIRFGSRARSSRAGESDRRSTILVSLSAAVTVLGFVLAMKVNSPKPSVLLPPWFRAAILPGLPVIAWIGVAFGLCGLALRLWAVLTLRHRYTKTLLIHEQHSIERSGPYRWVRHPGYLGSLLCLNGVGVASGNAVVLLASIAATFVAYAYRIKVEDEMLIAAFGSPYAEYRSEVPALIPSSRSANGKNSA